MAPVSLIALARAECHLRAGEAGEAERSLEQLPAPERKTPRAQALRAEVAYLQRDWQPLTELLADVRQAGIAPDEQINVWERTTWIALLSEADAASIAVSVWKRAPESLTAPEQPLWPALLEILQQDAQADALQRVLRERLQQHCEAVTLEAMIGLPDKQLLKMKKALERWRDEDSEGGCLAVLARIARIEGNAETEAGLWACLLYTSDAADE